MAYKLIGEDVSITIEIGNAAVPGGAAWAGTFASSATYAGLAKRLGVKSSLQKTNVKAVGDINIVNRYHSGSSQLDIEGFVPSGGLSFVHSGLNALGYFATVTVKELASLSAGETYTGVITDWSWDAASGSEQSEKITIDLNADAVA